MSAELDKEEQNFEYCRKLITGLQDEEIIELFRLAHRYFPNSSHYIEGAIGEYIETIDERERVAALLDTFLGIDVGSASYIVMVPARKPGIIQDYVLDRQIDSEASEEFVRVSALDISETLYYEEYECGTYSIKELFTTAKRIEDALERADRYLADTK